MTIFVLVAPSHLKIAKADPRQQFVIEKNEKLNDLLWYS